MGAFLDKPIITKELEKGEGNGLRYGLASMQGWRVDMEDSHTVAIEVSPKFKQCSFFAVFDGHAGSTCANASSVELIKTILSTEEFSQPQLPSEADIIKGLHKGFLRTDELLKIMSSVETGEDHSGCTAVAVFITPQDIYVANCGDSRVIFASKNQVSFASIDHKPSNPEERDRILKAGGTVMIQRVNGSLAVSRSLGDFDYKKVSGKGPTEQLVSPEPEITRIQRDPSTDEFIFLACDGIWDVLSNEEVMHLLRNRMCVHEDYSTICAEVLDTCLAKGSRDNMSAILIGLEKAPTVDPELQQKDSKLEENILRSTKEFLQSSGEDLMVTQVVSHIESLDFPDYPPGGLSTKTHLIEEQYNKHMAKFNKNKNSTGNCSSNSES